MTLTEKLKIVKQIQDLYKDVVLTGSLALIIQGLKIPERDYDIDLITNEKIPLYLILDEENSNIPDDGDNVELSHKNEDGAGFDSGFMYKGVKIEQRVLNQGEEEKFKVVNYEGNNYKVAVIYKIFYWKLLYAVKNNNMKHVSDLYRLLGIYNEASLKEDGIMKAIPKNISDDLPF